MYIRGHLYLDSTVGFCDVPTLGVLIYRSLVTPKILCAPPTLLSYQTPGNHWSFYYSIAL